ncbi:MAG: class I SAM-dependent rRNA methyltransferase [Alicyclobacillus macrosporangiidus]|uniref:class I SAM-dependent rRNA methyltransferase n=1 Tax=Alicyclobacillus macrosporangiidus TaxID=392015 RepID=UPI0026F2E3A3|nr:class I SAM-dependent rRNA methyltransferase [Alicyclobacillus macrosporangiidus]MCL6598596.1 class I SAM-dependent rRNA methyltransferase [Alicyclobacillus macrosporangiidus]
MPARLVLRQNRRRRLEQGHPWVYQSEVEHIDGSIQPGDIVDIVNHQGVFLARGYANPQSQIIARVLAYQPDANIDTSFLTRRVEQAWAYRQRFLPGITSCRAVYGEADFLPGLIVDKYEDVLVAQVLSYGMERLLPAIQEALIQVFQPRGILLRNDVPVRRLEGLPLEKRVLYGDVPPVVEITENGLTFEVDVFEGQKTGYFFDQRENRAAIRPIVQTGATGEGGAEVLECFCHTGSFTVHALHYGARHVTAVDISESAIEVAKRNVARNGFTGGVDFVVANAFDHLRSEEQAGRKYDVVILDPPAFAKSRHAVESACRGYKEINLRALKLIRDHGYLVTASCSFHVSPDRFQAVVLDAALDAHKIVRLVHWAGAGKDHPEIAGVDEGHYLKFAIYEVTSRS